VRRPAASSTIARSRAIDIGRCSSLAARALMPPTLAARSGATKERSSSSEFMKDGARREGDRERLREIHRREASRASLLEALQPQRGRQSRTRPTGSAARPSGRAVGAERSDAEILDGRPSGGYPGFSSDRARRRATTVFRREPPPGRGRRRDAEGSTVRAPGERVRPTRRDARTGVDPGKPGVRSTAVMTRARSPLPEPSAGASARS
jgi:hypothetical protein